MEETPIQVRFVFDVKKKEDGEDIEKYRALEFASRAEFQRQTEFVEPRGISQFVTTSGVVGINLSQMLYYYEVQAS